MKNAERPGTTPKKPAAARRWLFAVVATALAGWLLVLALPPHVVLRTGWSIPSLRSWFRERAIGAVHRCKTIEDVERALGAVDRGGVAEGWASYRIDDDRLLDESLYLVRQVARDGTISEVGWWEYSASLNRDRERWSPSDF